MSNQQRNSIWVNRAVLLGVSQWGWDAVVCWIQPSRITQWRGFPHKSRVPAAAFAIPPVIFHPLPTGTLTLWKNLHSTFFLCSADLSSSSFVPVAGYLCVFYDQHCHVWGCFRALHASAPACSFIRLSLLCMKGKNKHSHKCTGTCTHTHTHARKQWVRTRCEFPGKIQRQSWLLTTVTS